MKYMKPDFCVEEFMVNEAVAGCDRIQISQTTKIPKQDVDCIVTTTAEGVFNTASGCEMTAQYIVKVTAAAAKYYDCGMHALDALCDLMGNGASVPTDRCNGSAITLKEGDSYLMWHDGMNWHGGPFTTKIETENGYSW